MISYRKLAMRVLGHPLRVPTNTPRPASHRVTALALTAAMVAGMAAPAYAGTYYIGDGNITITKDTDGKTYVKHSNSTDKVKGDEDDGEIIIKGGKRSDDTTASGGSSSNGTASAASPAQPKLTTPPSEDIENEDKDMVYLGGTKGSDSSDGSGEENETDSTEKDQTGGKNTGAGSSDPESTGAGSSDPESTGAGSSDPESTGSESGTSGSENGTSGSESGTTGSDDTIGSDGDGTKADDTPTTGGEKNDPQPGGSPAPESQFTYTGAPLKVADANDDEGTRNESTTVLERAADNFTKNVIRIINNFIGNSSSKADNTLNVTLDNVNITAKNDAALSVEGAGDTKITLRGSNTLTNDLLHAGLEHNEKSEDGSYTGKLTITSEKDADGNDTGSLTATGGNGAAGIGSSDGNGAGTIEITGGDITAIGGNNAAGIGSGYNSNGTTTIKIDGSTIVKAQGGSGGDNSGGAGIGSGDIGGGYTGSSTTNITISGGTIVEAVGGNTGDGIGSGSGNRSNSTTVTINGGRVEKAQGGKGYSIFDGGDGIHSDDDLTIPGNATIVSAIGGSGVGSSGAGNGIYSGGKLAIEGGTIGTAQGGNATADYKGGGHGIYSNKELTINSGTIGTAQGGEGQTTGGNGIYSKGDLSIEGGTIGTAQGDKGYSRYYDAGDGIRSDGILTIKGGTIGTAKGGDGGKGDGGKGIFGRTMKILAGTIGTAKGGNATASNKNGGSGIHSDGYLTISGNATITNATGGSSTDSYAGDGIHSGGKLTISGGTIGTAQGGTGKNGGDGIYSIDDLTIEGGKIEQATGGNSTDATGGDGIHGDNKLTISGGTIGTAQGGIATADYKSGGSGIYCKGKLFISQSAKINNATGGSSIHGGNGIFGGTTMEIAGTIKEAFGGDSTGKGIGGHGIYSKKNLTISDSAAITSAKGGDSTDGIGGSGIRSDAELIISQSDPSQSATSQGATIGTAKGGDGKASGGYGIRSDGDLKIEGGTIGSLTTDDNSKQIPDPTTGALGGNAAEGENGGHGIYSKGQLFISGSADIINAKGGDGKTSGGDGIRSDKEFNISGGKIEQATGGNSTDGTGGYGIHSGSMLTISDSANITNATGGSGWSGGAGIDGDIVSISNTNTSLDITATSPDADKAIQSRDGKTLDKVIHLEENGKLGLVKLVENGVTRLFHNGVYTASLPGFSGSETHPLGDWVITKKPTCTEKGERQRSCKVKDCVVTETEELPALGHQWSGWMPVEGGSREYRSCAGCGAVEYRDVSHSSDSSDNSTLSTGLRVLDPAQADILQNAQLVRLSQIRDVLYIDVSHETASLQGVLSDLTGLRSERIETVVFSTERCTSTLSLSDVAALGAGDAPFTLSHSGSTATFTVGGADHSALLR